MTPAGWSATRWHLQLADAIADLLAHDAVGTRAGLARHLSVVFGHVDQTDVVAALELLPVEAKERFS